MSYIDGTSRDQTSLFPESIDELVPDDHPVRVVDAFVNRLKMVELGFTGTTDQVMGRPRYRPEALLKLYIYGYLNKVRSTRRLERESRRNIEVMWLLERLSPDFKTIADFRRDNGPAIQQVCRSFIQFCQSQGLIGDEVAIDGSKFQAAASRSQAITRSRLKKRRVAIEQQVAKYLAQLDRADVDDPEVGLSPDRVQSALDELAKVNAELDEHEEAMETLGKPQHCRTEPDARLMRSGQGQSVLGYNVQTAVETTHQLIVHHEVTQHGADNRLLYPVARATQAALQRSELSVLADAGYSSGEHLQLCDDASIEVTLPANRTRDQDKDHFPVSAFKYDAESDEYVCPAGSRLRRRRTNPQYRQYVYMTDSCRGCSLRSSCTSAKRGRQVSRHFDEAAFERVQKRLLDDPLSMERRKRVEPPFGTLKQQMENGRFLCKGLTSVSAEMGLSTLAYNLKRVMNVMGSGSLLAALTTA